MGRRSGVDDGLCFFMGEDGILEIGKNFVYLCCRL